MSTAEKLVELKPKASAVAGSKSSKDLAVESASNELVFAVVGHVGSGTSAIAELLAEVMRKPDSGGKYEVSVIKARTVLYDWAKKQSQDPKGESDSDIERTIWLADIGDELRKTTEDHSAVARRLVREIRAARAKSLGKPVTSEPIEPDGAPRAYVLDSIRHPAEVELLQHVYGAAFVLVGIVCDEDTRRTRLTEKYSNAGNKAASLFMERDAKASEKHGQRVADAFHMADYFVDNSATKNNLDWTIPEDLSRLKKIVTRSEVVRPIPGEAGMYAAHGAMMRSSCLSRQVGAALVDQGGAVIATGANEAPRAGGGTYSSLESDSKTDHRCAHWEGYCRNTREQNEIIDDLYALVGGDSDKDDFAKKLRGSRIGGLIEFSRAVHAEMETLLDAARRGSSTLGTTLYCTTFPCHYCARHLVDAGVHEVQYIEPYPKSRALHLHKDAITTSLKDWIRPGNENGRVLFRPFTGVAPRLFVRAFLKDRDLKDPATGTLLIAKPTWASPWHLARFSYAQLEAELGKDD